VLTSGVNSGGSHTRSAIGGCAADPSGVLGAGVKVVSRPGEAAVGGVPAIGVLPPIGVPRGMPPAVAVRAIPGRGLAVGRAGPGSKLQAASQAALSKRTKRRISTV
jgi:hypothetical protein